MGVKHVKAYGDSLLVVQQVAGEFQCLEGSLRVCLDACLDIIGSLTEFQIQHVPRHENQRANKHLAMTSVGITFTFKKSRCMKI
jgi:ribonuclease HI